jgi:hypothetical protein
VNDEKRRAAARARRRAEVFGEVLPDATSDERAPGADGKDGPDGPDGPGEGRDAGRDAADEWLRTNVPPHHGT